MEADMPTYVVRRSRGIGAMDLDIEDKIIEVKVNIVGEEELVSIHKELSELLKDSRNKLGIQDLLEKMKHQTCIYQEDLEIFCMLLTNCSVEDILRIKSMKCKSLKTKHSEYNALRDILHYCNIYGLYNVKLHSKKSRKFLTKCVDLFMRLTNDKLVINNELTFKDYRILNKAVQGYENLRKGLKNFNYGNFPESKIKKETHITCFTNKVLYKKTKINKDQDNSDKIIIKSKIYPDDIFAHKLWDDELKKYEIKKNLSQQVENVGNNFTYMNDSPIQDKIVKPKDMKEKWKIVAYNKKHKKDMEIYNGPKLASRLKEVNSFVLKTVGVDVKEVNNNMRKECNKLKKQQDKKLKKFGKSEYFWFLKDNKKISDITFDVTDSREVENRSKAKNIFEQWMKNSKEEYIKKNYYEVLNDIDENIKNEDEEDKIPLTVFLTKYSNIELKTDNETHISHIKKPKSGLKHNIKKEKRINKAVHVRNYSGDHRDSINRSDLLLKLNKKLNDKKVIMLDDLMVSLNSKSYASKGFRKDLRELINYVYTLNKDLYENHVESDEWGIIFSCESEDDYYDDEDDFIPYDSDMYNYNYYN